MSTSVSPAPDVSFTDWELVDERARTDPDIVAALDRSVGNFSLPYSFGEFKNEVGEALVTRFGPPPAVERGDKAYDIHETRYRVESDCLPSFLNGEYWTDRNSRGEIKFREQSTRIAQTFEEAETLSFGVPRPVGVLGDLTEGR